MFLRKTRRYYEVLHSFRHPATGKPTNRCIVRWPISRTLDEEIRYQQLEPWRAVVAAERRGLSALPWGKRRARIEAILRANSKSEKRLTALYRVEATLGKTGNVPRSSVGPVPTYLEFQLLCLAEASAKARVASGRPTLNTECELLARSAPPSDFALWFHVARRRRGRSERTPTRPVQR